MELKVKVIPNSKERSIEKKEDYYLVHLQSVPDKGKANKELIKFLNKEFKQKFELVKGLKSREKILKAYK